MKKFCNIIVVATVFVLFSLTSAMADDPVIWHVFSYPPVFIIENGKEPSGVGIDVINLIKSKLPEYGRCFRKPTESFRRLTDRSKKPTEGSGI